MTKKIILFLVSLLFFSTNAAAATKCFIIAKNDTIISQEGSDEACATRHSPASTFKIAISLMGFDSGILKDELHPQLPFKEGYSDFMNIGKQDQTPTSWIKSSGVWYSQLITKELGLIKFKKYVKKFNYGNQDVSGDKTKNNGLTNSWLSSSLKISPQEQITFLQKLINNKLPVSLKASEITKKLLFSEDLTDGWKLYGKTGAGGLLNEIGAKHDGQTGWFIGWMQKDNCTITFVHYVEEEGKKDYQSGRDAQESAQKKLIQWIEDNKK